MPWGATLGGRTIVFTNHPGSQDFEDRPNQIAGNWILPRAAQYENVLFCRITSYNVCYTKLLRCNFNFNLIVVDNRSNDGTTELLQSYNDARLIHLIPERKDLV